MCWVPVEKQEVKISTEKYEIGSQRNKTNKIQSTSCLKIYFILICPGTFLLEFLPTQLYPESKWGRQRMGSRMPLGLSWLSFLSTLTTQNGATFSSPTCLLFFISLCQHFLLSVHKEQSVGLWVGIEVH